MKRRSQTSQSSLGQTFLIVIAFILGGTGLSILFNTNGDQVSIIGGFALIGIAIAIVYKLLEDG